MVLDQASIEVINHTNETLYFYRQFINCVKCPLLQVASIASEQNETLKLKTYFSQKFVLTNINVSHWISPITDGCNRCQADCCTSLISPNDQSYYQILINSSDSCVIEELDSGQNEYFNAFVVLFGYFFGILLLTGGYHLVKRFYPRNVSSNGNNSPSDVPQTIRSNRYHSIDAFRGLTIMLMIFVNYGAGNYKNLQHAPWDGLYLADLVFAFFIFIMGVSIAISFKNVRGQNKAAIYKVLLTRILPRTLKLFLLGLVQNSFKNVDISTLRIPGVLFRFSISYCIVASVHLLATNLMITSHRIPEFLKYLHFWPQYSLAFVMLLIYSYFSFFWKFDENCPVGYVGPGGLSDNVSYIHCVGGAAHKIDELIFTANHSYRHYFGAILYDPSGQFHLWHDPEGLLGTTTSVVLTLIGVLAGHVLVSNPQPYVRFRRWLKMIISLAFFTVISIHFFEIPINKNLWSLSYITLTGCLATAILALFHYLIDHRQDWSMGNPLHYPGQNAIFLYLAHNLVSNVFPIQWAKQFDSHRGYLAENIWSALIWGFVSYWMAKNEIFITV